jgi:hypothetical protein
LIIPKNYDAPRRHGIPLPMLSSQTRFSYCLTGVAQRDPQRAYFLQPGPTITTVHRCSNIAVPSRRQKSQIELVLPRRI